MSNSLSKVHLELISEWSDKSDPLTQGNITFGSYKSMMESSKRIEKAYFKK